MGYDIDDDHHGAGGRPLLTPRLTPEPARVVPPAAAQPLLYAIVSFEAFENSRRHGFWEGVDPNDVTVQLSKLALIMSEAGEAVEAVRDDWTKPSVKAVGHTVLAEELADIVIRCADFAGAMGIDLAQAIITKHQYNASRPHKHGRKA